MGSQEEEERVEGKGCGTGRRGGGGEGSMRAHNSLEEPGRGRRGEETRERFDFLPTQPPLYFIYPTLFHTVAANSR